MIIRRLEKQDLYSAGMISHIAFHSRSGDLEVTANRETLAGVFRRRPIYIGDHF